MRNFEKENNHCIICEKKTKLAGIIELQRQSKYQFALKCDHCEFIFFRSNYSEDENQLKADLNYCLDHSEAIIENSNVLFSKLQPYLEGDEIILDLGCGAGFLVKTFAMNGYQAHGLEINEFCIKYARESLNLQNIHDFLFDENFPYKVSLITLIGVLEHLQDPLDLLLKIKLYSRNRNMKIFINVPWIEYERDIAKISDLKKTEEYPFHDNSVHINHFSAKSIMVLARKLDLNLITWIDGPLPGYLLEI